MRMPATIAIPPIRGTGELCTRGRSLGTSSAPMRGANHAAAGVSTSTIAAASTNPHIAAPLPSRASRDSDRDIPRTLYSRAKGGNPPASIARR